MEYAAKGDLFDYVVHKENLTEDEAWPFFRQLILGVKYCHGKMVAHRDLKLENLLLDENLNLKISYFGLSAIMVDNKMLKMSCGSPHYAAPEVLSGDPYHGTEVDVWSCGVILYTALCGYYPYGDGNTATILDKIQTTHLDLPGHLSTDVQDLISRMLKVVPDRRFTITEISKHP